MIHTKIHYLTHSRLHVLTLNSRKVFSYENRTRRDFTKSRQGTSLNELSFVNNGTRPIVRCFLMKRMNVVGPPVWVVKFYDRYRTTPSGARSGTNGTCDALLSDFSDRSLESVHSV